MTISEISRSARLVLAASALLLAAACSRAPGPDAYAEPPPPPPGPNAELLGEGPPPPPYAPPERYAPDRFAEAPPPPPYPAQRGPDRPPVVIAMEPIPNPPERPRRERTHRRAGRTHAETARRPGQAAPVRRVRPQRRAEAPRKAAPAAPLRQRAARPPAPAARSAPAKPSPQVAAKPASAAQTPPTAATTPKPQPAPTPPAIAKAPPPPAVRPTPAPPEAVTPATPPLAGPQDRAARLARLQTALTQALAKAARFQAPERFTAGQAAQVTLDIPAEFGDVVLSEAQKAGLSDVAGSVNLTAVLSGDGFSVTPADIAAQPLTPGQPTSFTWQVVAMRGAKGPLHADLGADLNGAGAESLDLGALKVADGTGGLSPRIVGASLLVLIAALVVAWLARGRKAPPAQRTAAAAPPPPPAPEPKPEPAPAHASDARPANDPEKG